MKDWKGSLIQLGAALFGAFVAAMLGATSGEALIFGMLGMIYMDLR